MSKFNIFYAVQPAMPKQTTGSDKLTTLQKSVSIVLALFMTGCAHTEKYLHPEKTFSLDKTEENSQQLDGLPIYENCADKASIHSPIIWLPLIGPAIDVSMSSKNIGTRTSRWDNAIIFLPLIGPAASFSWLSPETCTYKTFKQSSETINSAIPVKPETVAYIANIADQNCSIFLDRLSSSKDGLEFSKTALTDVGAVVASGAAFASPLGAAVVTTASLLTSKGAENLAHTYFGGQLIPAIKHHIATAREEYKYLHYSKAAGATGAAGTTGAAGAKGATGATGTAQHTMPATLSEVIYIFDQYDKTCSVQTAIDKLNTPAPAKE